MQAAYMRGSAGPTAAAHMTGSACAPLEHAYCAAPQKASSRPSERTDSDSKILSFFFTIQFCQKMALVKAQSKHNICQWEGLNVYYLQKKNCIRKSVSVIID